MTRFDDMWVMLQQARAQRSDVSEFRMAESTRRDLVRALESRQAMEIDPNLTATFNIPIVVDERMPPGAIGAIVDTPIHRHVVGPVSGLLSRNGQGVSTSPDESHGMTIDELLDDIDSVLADHKGVKGDT